MSNFSFTFFTSIFSNFRFLCLRVFLAILIASSAKSIPKTYAPFFAALRAKFPVPHPTSNTCFDFQFTPLRISTASDEGVCLVTKCV